MSRALAIVQRLDHLVLTCANVSLTTQWYQKYLGMKAETFTSPSDPSTQRTALKFGSQKINLHQQGKEFEPKAQTARPGTADLCFLLQNTADLEEVIEEFKENAVEVLEEGKVVQRTGANGTIRSIYVRDPDGNLIELSQYLENN
ncbi:Glyoxalase/Bleomycin resistance protein/Dihydroxybiphenyl dioxygenase [Thozetella sp. PMI_491]|nr:Glyoxalase/Bleomycin resistance protein/Dihydroxybiphenyl dioxygenase [Thozetella sp. PMI_491]